MLRVAIFVSGRGSNLKSLIDYFKRKPGKVEFSAVISNNPECKALELAAENNLRVFIVGKKSAPGLLSWELLAEELKANEIGLIVLAGFLKKIPDFFVDLFEYKIINIHPALLPSFGGKGMYGENVHKAVFDASCQISGPTVHFVNKIYDDGLIVAQKGVDILNVESWEEIAKRVLAEEHKLLPYVVEKFAENKVKIINKRVYINR